MMKHLIGAGVVDGSCVTVTGRTLSENVAEAAQPPEDQELIAAADAPYKPYADMQICFGNLAPEGIVFKVSSIEQPRL